MSYICFTIEERKSLKKFKKQESSVREMTKQLDRSPSSICREIFKNNCNRDHWRASCL